MWYLYTIFYAVIKKNEILSLAGKWMELENIILSDVSQIQKTKGYMFSLMYGIQAQYKYKQYYMYLEIYTEHVFKHGTGRGEQGSRERRKQR
jgi:hypothetical protein